MSQACRVEGCERTHRARGLCNGHYERLRRHGELNESVPLRRRVRGGVSYSAAVHRLRAVRGPARGQSCAECGGPAVCWSYDGSDPDARVEPGRGQRYSLDPARYRPRCRSCHRFGVAHGGQVVVLDLKLVARLYVGGASTRGIAKRLKVSPGAINTALRRQGVTLRAPGRARRAATQPGRSTRPRWP